MNKEIMTLNEVAKYLRISQKTLIQWALDKTVPCCKLGDEWRFKRDEIEQWVEKRFSNRTEATNSIVILKKVLNSRHVKIMNVQNKNEALQALIDILHIAAGLKKRSELEEAIYHREKLMSTGIGLGVAVPHVRLASIKTMRMAVGINKIDITDYESLDNQPVRIIVMVAAGKGQHQEYIRLLASPSSILKQTRIREKLLETDDTNFIYKVLTGNEN